MGFLNHPPSGLFTNKFLHISINNKIISINRKEAYIVPNSFTKARNNKIRSSITKMKTSWQKHSEVVARKERLKNKFCNLSRACDVEN
jgi:hypothetical protein